MAFKSSSGGAEPTYEDFRTKLPLLDAISKEAYVPPPPPVVHSGVLTELLRSLRMYPPPSHTERVAVKDDVVPLQFPVKDRTGKDVTSIRIQKGHVSRQSLVGTEGLETC